MPLPPEVIRINALWRRQLGCQRVGLTALGATAVSMGLGFLSLGPRFATVACTATCAVAVAALLVGTVFSVMISRAVKSVTLQSVADAPVEPGERFGRMVVRIADSSILHLASGESPVRAGLQRLCGCLALLGLALAIAVLAITDPTVNARVWGLAGVAVSGALYVARLPFCMQWVAGDVHQGRPGISMERVRWFFVRDTFTVDAADIADLTMTAQELTLVTRRGERITLLRTGRSPLGTWEKLRLVAATARAVGRQVQATDRSGELEVA